MSSDMGGLVVSTGGYSHSGGGTIASYLESAGALVKKHPFVTAFVVLLIILFIMYLVGVFDKELGFRDHAGSRLGHLSTRDDGYGEASETNMRLAYGGVSEGFRDQDAYNMIKSGFVNSREAPYFPDVTARVMRMENREKEAIRALGKINQERQRRSTDNEPLEWGPFWKEWKNNHPMGGEVEGFNPTKDLIPY